jgi:tetratricopeptide (TPR) repeat protein
MKTTITLFYLLMIIAAVSSCGHVNANTEQERIEDAYQDSLKQVLKPEEEKRAAERLDSLMNYCHLSDSLELKHQWKKAIFHLDSALLISSSKGKDSLFEKRAALHFRAHQYELAIVDYTNLIDRSVNYAENLYQRALCYQKQNEIQLAVNDLKEAIELGHEEAETLHEKINPERKRIAYYVTRCRDGSTSNASGRGACSHHGGVKNWNEPVYETYRKY